MAKRAATPNEYAMVEQLNNERPELLQDNTEQSILEFMTTLGPRLASKDANWGYLTKSAGEKHLTLPNGQFIAVDAFIYNATQQVVDCISNAVDSTPAGPAWGEQEKRDNNDWYPIEASSGGSEGSSVEERLAAVEKLLGDLNAVAVKFGDRVGLQCSNNTILCAEDGGPREVNQPFNLTSRSGVGPWESWILHRGQG